MKKIYGIADEEGNIYAVYSTPPSGLEFEVIELVENYTWEESDYSDRKNNLIRKDRLAYLFDQLCKKTGLKKTMIAQICGKSPETISRYCSGEISVPRLVWDRIASYITHNNQKKGF